MISNKLQKIYESKTSELNEGRAMPTDKALAMAGKWLKSIKRVNSKQLAAEMTRAGYLTKSSEIWDVEEIKDVGIINGKINVSVSFIYDDNHTGEQEVGNFYFRYEIGTGKMSGDF